MTEQDRADWTAYLDGDEAAFRRLYDRHRRQLLDFLTYTSGDRALAEDVLQETFARLVRLRDRSLRSPRDWLFICARNLLFNCLRDQKRESVGYLHPSTSFDGDDFELRRFVDEVLSQLSTEERELILLRERVGYSVTELAELLGVSNEAVRVRLHRIRKKMAKLAEE